jgi:hypothetical protein
MMDIFRSDKQEKKIIKEAGLVTYMQISENLITRSIKHFN